MYRVHRISVYGVIQNFASLEEPPFVPDQERRGHGATTAVPPALISGVELCFAYPKGDEEVIIGRLDVLILERQASVVPVVLVVVVERNSNVEVGEVDYVSSSVEPVLPCLCLVGPVERGPQHENENDKDSRTHGFVPFAMSVSFFSPAP